VSNERAEAAAVGRVPDDERIVVGPGDDAAVRQSRDAHNLPHLRAHAREMSEALGGRRMTIRSFAQLGDGAAGRRRRASFECPMSGGKELPSVRSQTMNESS
jgi:hypothetical protein